MKKILFASALLLAISGIGFAQTTPTQKTPEKTTTSHKHAKHHAGKKAKEEKKDNKQGQ